MSATVAKVIEISSESPKGFEDAIAAGIKRAHKTIKNIKGAWIEGQKVIVENGKVVAWRVDMKLTFILE
jgi:flavin-binding protein dodecin